MLWFAPLGLAALTIATADLVPSDYEARDLYIRFERAGYRGNVYLNADGTYVIVQTRPGRATENFVGAWTPNGVSGFCIEPKESPRKCFERMPQTVDEKMSVVSDLDEVYVVALKEGR